MNREQLVEMLRSNVYNIVFTKTDGSERKAKATLLDEYLPEFKNSGKMPNPDIVSFWDLDLGEWRSFRVENLVNIELGGS